MSADKPIPPQRARDYLRLNMNMDAIACQLESQSLSTIAPFLTALFLILGVITFMLTAVLVSGVLGICALILMACCGFFSTLANRQSSSIKLHLNQKHLEWSEGRKKHSWSWEDIQDIKVYSTGPELLIVHRTGKTLQVRVEGNDIWNASKQIFEPKSWLESMNCLEWLAETMKRFQGEYGSDTALPEAINAMRVRPETRKVGPTQ